MFGPLPRLHQVLVVLIGLTSGAVVGLWLWAADPGLTTASTAAVGAAVGALAGLGTAYALLHDFHHERRRSGMRARRH